MIHFTEELITPEKATAYLALNIHDNRVLKPSWVNYLIGVLQRGEWKVTHQGIAFDEGGRMIDGQHRLTAIEQSGIAARMVVARAAPSETFEVIDGGKVRNTGDHLNLDQTFSSALNFLSRQYFGRVITSPQQKKALLPAVGDPLAQIQAKCAATRKYFSSGAMRAAAAIQILLHPNDMDYILELYENLVRFNLEQLPPVAASLIRQYSVGGFSSRANDLFLRGLVVFDPDKRNLSKITVHAETGLEAISRVRNVIKQALREAGADVPPHPESALDKKKEAKTLFRGRGTKQRTKQPSVGAEAA
jgi:hypothetical protein